MAINRMLKKSLKNHRDEGRGFSDTLAVSGLWGFVRSADATLLSPHRRSHPRSLRDRSPTVPVSLSLCHVPRFRSAIAPKAQTINMGYHPLPGALLRANGRHMVL